jgi:hypothetical protein
MEILLVVGGLLGLAILAMRFGYDSRDGVRSEEQVLATFGFTWDRTPRGPHQPPRRQRAYALRHRLAVGLNVLADWLYPVESPEKFDHVLPRA